MNIANALAITSAEVRDGAAGLTLPELLERVDGLLIEAANLNEALQKLLQAEEPGSTLAALGFDRIDSALCELGGLVEAVAVRVPHAEGGAA